MHQFMQQTKIWHSGRSAKIMVCTATVGMVAAIPWLIALFTQSTVHAGTSFFWQFQLTQVFILSIYAISYNLLLGYTGLLSLGHALFFGGAAYTFGISLRSAEMNWIPAMLLSFAVVALLSLIFSLFAMRTSGIYLGVTTFVLAQIFHMIVSSPNLTSITGADDGLRRVPVPGFIDPMQGRLPLYYLTFLLLILTLWFVWYLMATPVGRALVAIRENGVRATHLGYRLGRYKMFVFFVSSMLAALAGMLSTVLFRGTAPSTLSIDQTALALIAVVIGGAGTLIGPVVGVLIVFLLREVLRAQLGMSWPVVYALMGIVLIMVARQGIVGVLRERFDGASRPNAVPVRGRGSTGFQPTRQRAPARDGVEMDPARATPEEAVE